MYNLVHLRSFTFAIQIYTKVNFLSMFECFVYLENVLFNNIQTIWFPSGTTENHLLGDHEFKSQQHCISQESGRELAVLSGWEGRHALSSLSSINHRDTSQPWASASSYTRKEADSMSSISKWCEENSVGGGTSRLSLPFWNIRKNVIWQVEKNQRPVIESEPKAIGFKWTRDWFHGSKQGTEQDML